MHTTLFRSACASVRGGRHDGTLSTEEVQMGKVETDVEHGVGGQGGQFMDGLSSRDRQNFI